MPPEENTNKNTGFSPLKVGIDPVFKSVPQSQVDKNQGADISAYGVLNNQKYAPNQGPVQTPAKTAENNLSGPKSIVRTYKGDLESAIAANHLSSINIAIAENQKMHGQINTEQQSEEIKEESDYSKNKIIVFVSLILMIAGIVAISAVYFINSKNVASVTPVQELPSLITTEYKDELSASAMAKNKFASTLSVRLNETQIPVNNLYNTYITIGTSSDRRLATSAEFIALMDFKMPDIIKRTLLPDFMAGMYSFGKNLPFVILKTSSFENSYAGMLGWETDLQKDFQILFRLPGYEKAGGILDQLTPMVAKKFEDGVIVNKDVRILRDDNGNMILLYGIVDKETIIITVNDTAFKEIITRLNKEKTLKR